MKLAEKVVIVTGGASGLGLVTCQHLSAAGAKVVIFDLNVAAGEALAQELSQAIFAKVDVTDEASVTAGIDRAITAFSAIHILVNCAGIAPGGKTVGRNGALDLQKFSQVININLIGSFNVLRLAAEKMANNQPDESGERGVIINTASVAAFDGQMGQAAYSASKAGIAGMTLPVARDLAKLNIRNMTIAPGIFDTPMMQAMTDEVREPLIGMVQSPQRFGAPIEYAKMVAHIIDNGYLNGEVIRLDGALRMSAK
jgi:3-hydroxyacyl-CoA dehydrogenase/3-hydroxy-2-methylbutyryl-CoA dehydrogenase